MNIPFSALYDTSGAPVEADVLDVGNALLCSKEQLEQTPSRKEGIDSSTEEKLRLKACEIIHGALALCGVDRSVICTAHVYLHRYYCQRSIAAFNFKYVALGVSYLALKTEETNITEEELIPVFCRFLQRAYASESQLTLDPGWVMKRSSEYELWWDWLVCLEMDILIAFGFKLHVARPHKLMFTYLQKLELTDIMQEAWNVLNDSYFTTACVRYKSEVLACGAIFYVTRKHKIALPQVGLFPWWELFGATERELHEFALMIHELYSRLKEDFDFTEACNINYKNERADGLKRPHPSLLRPSQPDPLPNAEQRVQDLTPPKTRVQGLRTPEDRGQGSEMPERHRARSPRRTSSRHRRDSRERRRRSSRRDRDSERYRSRDRHRSSRY